MTFLVKSSLALLISSTLVACAGTKGDFDVEDVQTPQKQINTHTSRDIKTDPREKAAQVAEVMKPAYGYSVKIPRRNWHPQSKNIEQEAGFTAKDVQRIDESSLDIPYLKEVSDYFSNSPNYTHNEQGTELQKRNLSYVRTGYVYNLPAGLDIDHDKKTVYTGPKGYVYYRGTNPSSEIPLGSNIKYSGTWDFVSNAKASRGRLDGFGKQDSPGKNVGAMSLHENVYDGRLDGTTDKKYKKGHGSEFEVDFANKTLTGKLYKHSDPNFASNTQESILRYSIEAKLSGNRFSGKAIAQKEKPHEIFASDSKSLEGGFFGPHAEELAGKFLADDDSLFAVFGAKRDKQDNEQTEKLFDAVKIGTGFDMTKLDNFGDARKLLLNGQEISLVDDTSNFTVTKEVTQGNKTFQVNVCCHNLDYTKFGLLSEKTQEKFTNVELFLQGERTKTADVPKNGSATYKGTWEGRIEDTTPWSTSAGKEDGESKAEFEVDFDKKKLTGTLTATNGVRPAFIISGNIEGNGFTGTAKTGERGLNLDPDNTLNHRVFNLDNAEVKGGFFGKAAEELGGAFQDEGKKVGVVFGAKRQENQ
ncbi:transferrin-binding protein-like solute binding protein [Pasteurella sp. PK-2025]|uniref:transferrin-binding protein-like solute binding protein n=1 Tax=unclassified Pasteurella TaxID=2621516 RepID=UPI003C7455E3